MELCKTRTKKSSPDLFNFYVVLAGHDMVTVAGRATMCTRNIKAHDFKQSTRSEGPFEDMGFNGKTV